MVQQAGQQVQTGSKGVRLTQPKHSVVIEYILKRLLTFSSCEYDQTDGGCTRLLN